MAFNFIRKLIQCQIGTSWFHKRNRIRTLSFFKIRNRNQQGQQRPLGSQNQPQDNQCYNCGNNSHRGISN